MPTRSHMSIFGEEPIQPNAGGDDQTCLEVRVEMLASTDEPTCGLDIALAVMGGKWKPLILYHLSPGAKRFGELKRLVDGISEKVLIQQLRELATAGVLARHDYQQVPPKVDYTITAFGMTLVEALMPLCHWGTDNRAEVEKFMPQYAAGQQT